MKRAKRTEKFDFTSTEKGSYSALVEKCAKIQFFIKNFSNLLAFFPINKLAVVCLYIIPSFFVIEF